LKRLTGWPNERVLYFGDHPYADLVDLSMEHGWRTGAIIEELEDEIVVMNSDEFKWNVNWANVLHLLLEHNQHRTGAKDKGKLEAWNEELKECRYSTYLANIGRLLDPQTAVTFVQARLEGDLQPVLWLHLPHPCYIQLLRAQALSRGRRLHLQDHQSQSVKQSSTMSQHDDHPSCRFAVDHKFYPRRGALPHDFRAWFV